MTTKNLNFAERAINEGFKVHPQNTNPINGLFGAVASPAPGWPTVIYNNGNKTIIISIQGLGMPEPENRTEKYYQAKKSCAVKFIGLYNYDRCVYASWYGTLPADEFINDFFNNIEPCNPETITINNIVKGYTA